MIAIEIGCATDTRETSTRKYEKGGKKRVAIN